MNYICSLELLDLLLLLVIISLLHVHLSTIELNLLRKTHFCSVIANHIHIQASLGLLGKCKIELFISFCILTAIFLDFDMMF